MRGAVHFFLAAATVDVWCGMVVVEASVANGCSLAAMTKIHRQRNVYEVFVCWMYLACCQPCIKRAQEMLCSVDLLSSR